MIKWGMPFQRKYPHPEAGDRFGMLTVERVYKSSPRHYHASCECDCGKHADIRLDHLRSGASQSCGCVRNQESGNRLRTHGETGTPLHRAWVGMRNRTRDEGSSVWEHYGGRGIRMCDEWGEYEAFRDWALANGWHEGFTIDRIDVNGDYEPSNCRWVTQKENARNKRNNNYVTAFGETHALSEWVEDERCPVAYGTAWARLKRGWQPERALSAPLGASRGA